MDMDKVMIAYNLPSEEHPGGQIKVGPHPDKTGWSRGYLMTVGACFLARKKLSKELQTILMFLDFHTAVVRDRIDPQLAHKEFLKIKQYRLKISPDIEGATALEYGEERPANYDDVNPLYG